MHDFALGMVELGLGRGDVIGIIGDNRPDWVAAEIATHAIGGLSLGLYRDVLDEEAAYLLNYGEAQAGVRRGRGAGRQAARRWPTACRI